MSDGIDKETANMKWDLVLCLLLAWIFIFFCLIKGVKSSGKVSLSCYSCERSDAIVADIR